MSILIIGECMMELRDDKSNALHKSFAGDTYNSAVYAKRYCSELSIKYLTCLGCDSFSQQLSDTAQSFGIDLSLCPKSTSAPVGIYAISTDEYGERSFTYWRKHSAATLLMEKLDIESTALKCADVKYVYFSGISLAIFSPEDRTRLLTLIETLKQQGALVVFDPNYRPTMWQSTTEAITWFEACYALADIALPGLDDHAALFNHQTKDEIQHYFAQFKVNELVIKCGQDGVYANNGAEHIHIPFEPAPVQVDSTAAGDSFAGTYLASRAQGIDVTKSVLAACAVAREVVQHHGAIISDSAYKVA